MSKEKDCNVSLFETLPVYFLRFLDKSTLRRKTACSKESRGETPDIQDGGGTRHFKNPEEKGNVLRCRRSKKSDHEKSLLFLLEYFLSSSLSSLYRSGLCRQKTFAWLSPEAVTATDASLKEDDVKKESQHSSVTEETFKTAREREREMTVSKWYLLMVKSRISAVWPRYSDTMLPVRASHRRSAPSKQQVDTTEEDSSHCR